MIQGIPLPATDDPLDAEFWAWAREGRLVVQGCGQCGARRFPPRPMCPHCQSEEVRWDEDPGGGHIWSFATPRPPLLPAFEALLPYVVIVGALDSDPAIRIVGMLDGDLPDGDAIAIGWPIHLVFKAVGDDCALPFWRLGPKATSRPSGRPREIPT
ncbi:zinc ribbon domain-containing protein [Sphingomonas sp. YL-JM2C]|jgi:uncharacterized OB-fold protein